MKILLISGFLGAGKTTFIKELINRTDERPVIMENEYGDNNLDSNELRQSTAKEEDIQILEFMEGCVCCTMKDSFVNSVLTVFSSLSPEYLIIEPTGVGRLSSIIDNLRPILGSAISLLDPVVIISPDNYRQNMNEWMSLYSDQIANARKVVFSKCEKTDPDIIEDVTREVHKLNPDAQIIGRHYTQMDQKWWDELFTSEGEVAEEPSEPAAIQDESFSQVSFEKVGVHNPAQLIQLMEDCLHGEYGHVARAKGTIWVNDEMLRFDLADRMYAITDSQGDSSQCVFIGKNINEKKLRMSLYSGERSARYALR